MKAKQMISMAAVLALAANMAGCGGARRQKTNGPEVSLEHSYASEQVTVEGVKDIYEIYPMGDNYLLGCSDEDYNPVYNLYDTESGSVKRISLNHMEQMQTEREKNNNDGMEGKESYIVAAVTSSQNDLYIYYSTYSWSEDTYENLGMTLEIYDADMNLKDTKEFPDLKDMNFNYLTLDGSDRLFAGGMDEQGNTFLNVYDLDFNEKGSVKLSNVQYISGMYKGKDGGIILIYNDMEYNEKFARIAPDSLEAVPVEIEGMPQWFNGRSAGSGDYELFVYDSTSAYGIRDNKAEEVINWINSDFLGDYIRTCVPLSDGRYLVSCSDQNYEKCELWVLTERDPKELEKMQVLSLATLYSSQNLTLAVRNFNRSHDDCRIALADYQKYATDEDPEAGLTKLKNDMTSGIVADLVCVDSLPFESFANKGLFQDLNELMDEDKDFNRSDYFENYFQSLEYGGKLYRIGPCFSVQTLAAKEEFVGTESGMTLDEFVEKVQNLPKGMTAFEEMTRNTAHWNLIMNNLNCFVDEEKGTCDFNNERFTDLLEYCKTFPEEITDYDNMEDSDWDKYWEERDMAFRDDKVLFYSCYLSSLRDYHQMAQGTFGGEKITLTGYPTVDGTGNGGRFGNDYTVAISANSAYKDIAWEFICSILSPESQAALSWSIPVLRSAFDEKMAQEQKPDTYTDENGNEVEQPQFFGNGNMQLDIGYPTADEAAAIKSYIEGVTVNSYYDSDIYDIITEETDMFYSGDQSAADAAKMVQSRVSLYLSESH